MKPKKDNTFCHHPFNQITLKKWDEFGQLKISNPCCQMSAASKKNVKIHDVKNKTPIEIFNSDEFQQIRKNKLSGIRSKSCSVCWDMEDRGLTSFRLYSGDHEYEKTELNTIDITLNNHCNLRCRMCFPQSSHSLLYDRKKMLEYDLLNIYEIAIKNDYSCPKRLSNYDSIQIKWLYENNNTIKKLRCSGGEPFYDKKIIELLNKFVIDGSSVNMELEFHTNATLFSDEIVSLNSKFKKINHIFSIDGVDKTYEYIRHHSFEKLEISIDNFLKKCNSIDVIKINLVLSAFNLLNVKEWEDWLCLMFRSHKRKFFSLISEVYPYSRGISIKNLPVYILEEAKKRTTHPQLHEIVNYSINNNSENKRLMMDEVLCLDKVRNQSFEDYLDPMIVEWLKS